MSTSVQATPPSVLRLTAKIKNTYKRAQSDPDYTTFLKHFGEFVVAKIDRKEISSQEFIMEELKAIKQSVARLVRSTPTTPPTTALWYELALDVPPNNATRIARLVERHFPDVRVIQAGSGKIIFSSIGDLSLEKFNSIRSYIDRKAAQYRAAELGAQVHKDVSVETDDETAS